ncbi:MAG: hypothetical protein E6J20_18535 [Chloroflexi bacterium]|nr:MAG: hypothetical protein E6J20_18535 [Chloroflexota bacterium]
MGRALVCNSAGKLNTGGGTFADTLAAVSPDSLSVANYDAPADVAGARVLEMWGIDSASVAEIAVTLSRQQSVNDQTRGVRFNIPALIPGGAGTVGSHNMLPGLATIPLYKSDTFAFTVTSTANDEVCVTWNTLYDDLPGVNAVLASWDQVQALRYTTIGLACNAVASGTAGSTYGTARALNADDTRLIANTWYAILGITVQTIVCSVTFTGPDWGGQRLGLPAGALTTDSATYFVDQSVKWGKPLIPCFNSNNQGNINVQVLDSIASTSPKIDFLMYGLTGKPGF